MGTECFIEYKFIIRKGLSIFTFALLLLRTTNYFFFSAPQPWVGLGLLSDPPPLIPISRLLHPSTNSHSS